MTVAHLIARLTYEVSQADKSFRILPAGRFRARDGRPAGLSGWLLTGQRAAELVAAAGSKKDEYLIDFEHASLSGRAAPAAGWFSRIEWREGQGLFAAGVRWTERAKAMILGREYRYVSPVFRFSAATGEVTELLSVGLTNNPALDGLTDLEGVAVNSISPRATPAASGQPIDWAHMQSIHNYNRTFAAHGVMHPETDKYVAAMGMSQSAYIAKLTRDVVPSN